MSDNQTEQVETDDESEMAYLKKLGMLLVTFNTRESVQNGRAFIPRPTDVFVTTFPKCGTTWVTQICHILRSRGNMDFGEITEVCPWDCQALDCGQNIDDEQVFHPRIFKSHEFYTNIAKNSNSPAKYVVVFRHPKDSFVSFYKFLPNYLGIEPGKISMNTFAVGVTNDNPRFGNIWNFMLDWYDMKDKLKDNILFVAYETLIRDIESQIKRIAAFMNIELDEELLAITKEKSGFEFMRAHQSQFDDHFVYERRREYMGLGPFEEFKRTGKVRETGGKVGSGSILTEALDKQYDERWQSIITAKTGIQNYEEFLTKLGID